MKRLIYTLLLILGVAGMVLAQSKQSDAFFAHGVDLYNQGNFSDAAEQFLQADLLDRQELDSLSLRRSYSSEWLASCYYKLGDLEKAKSFSEDGYHLSPVDRRLTVDIDRLSQLADSYIREQNFPAALDLILQVENMEHNLFSKDHHINIGTCQLKSICYLNMGQADEGVACMDELLRLDRLHFSKTSKRVLSDLNAIFFINVNINNFSKASSIVNEIEEIIKDFPDNDPERGELAYKKLTLSLAQRRWDEAHNQLADYVDLLYRIFGNDPQMLNNCFGTLNNVLMQCGRNDDLNYVYQLISSHSNELSFRDKFFGVALSYIRLLEQKKSDEANAQYEELERMLANNPDSEIMTEKAVLECVRCFKFATEGKFDEAKDQYIYIQDNNLEQYLEDNELKPIYLSVKANMAVLVDDFEGSVDAYHQLRQSMTEPQRIQNLNIDAMLACTHALSGNYNEARKVSKETVKMYRENVVDKKAVYRLDKDTMQLNQIINILGNMTDTYQNMPDSAIYALRDIKCDYINLKADFLRNLDRYQFNDEYLYTLTDYARELLYMRKYIEAQEVMDSYLTEWEELYKTLLASDAEIDVLDRLLAVDPMSFALYFRSRFCFEKGDPAAEKAHQDNLAFIKWYQGEDSDEYKSALMFYYMQMADDKKLISLLTPMIDANPDNYNLTAYNALADAYYREGDGNNYIKYKTLGISQEYSDLESQASSLSKIRTSIHDVLSYYIEEKKDTTAVLNYYRDHLWPDLRNYSQQYSSDFLYSIRLLNYNISNDAFISYIESEIEQHPEVFVSNPFKAGIYIYTADVLNNGRHNRSLSLEYLEKARQYIKDDAVLNLLFDCYRYQILAYSNDDQRIDYGYSLMEKMRASNQIFTHEYAELILRQIMNLYQEKRFTELEQLCRRHLDDYTAISGPTLQQLFNYTHPHYSELGYINECTLADYSSDGAVSDAYKYLYKIEGLSSQSNSADYALPYLKNIFSEMKTWLNLNHISTYRCDELISTSAKMAYKHQTDSLKMYAYDAALLCKGLQLRSDHAVRALIKKSGHRSALRKYDELEFTTRMLANAPDDQVEALEKKRKDLQYDLNRLSRSFGDYTKSLYMSWKDVQKALTDNDIAIEFMYVSKDYDEKYVLEDTTFSEGYYASILRKDMKAPEIVYLTDDAPLSITPDIYSSTHTGQRLLAPLLPYLEGMRNVYFSPIGVLNQISLEALPLDGVGGSTFSSRYNVHRLSSTRELIGNEYEIEGKDAVIYGGLAYDTSIEYLKADAQKYPQSRAANLELKTNTQSRVSRTGMREALEGIPYLGGTRREAENVASTINNSRVSTLHADMMLGDAGTESAFKSLDGLQKRVIHIATHGFYYTQKESEEAGLVSDVRSRNMKKEDTSLLRSGLLLAGAENRLMMEEIPEGIEDGVLTSQEIANLDLSGLDLCVLSACQTAQGDVSSEGVFGLQRGFKKAGAKSILMSLWKVDDEATCHLMTEFYRHWIGENKSKHESLELAKQSVRRQKSKGWDAPQYWAAFILLDDI